MGGYGSGRRQNAKLTTEDCLSLDVRKLRRDGLLTYGMCFDLNWTVNHKTVATIQVCPEANRLVLHYFHRSHGGGRMPLIYAVNLDSTPCAYGGRRAWFLCPACGRRVAKLYFGGAGIFSCRHCNRLAYQCQREADDYRAMRRADSIRDRLGWGPGIFNGQGDKPRGMHWNTFEQFIARHDAFFRVAMEGHARWIEHFSSN